MKYMIALMLALTLNATANVMMRVGSQRLSKGGVSVESGIQPLIAAFATNWVLIVGLCCFALNVLFYIYALSAPHMKISLAYPIMVGGGFVIIAIVGKFWLAETLTAGQWAGVVAIMLGVWLVAREMMPNAAG